MQWTYIILVLNLLVIYKTMGLKCVNVLDIMKVDAPDFKSTHLTISTLVVAQETNGIVKVAPTTYRFGGKYIDDVWVKKKKYSPRILPSVKHYNFSFFVFFKSLTCPKKTYFQNGQLGGEISYKWKLFSRLSGNS